MIGPGALSWAALYLGGFHPALALVPIVPFMPHCARDLGLFDPREGYRSDTLNRFEHWWATPVQFVLLLFGFANAGVPFEQIGARHVLRAWPDSFWASPSGSCFSRGSHGWLVGACRPGFGPAICWWSASSRRIGFTVSLFFATAAFPGGAALAETKMGALLSFVAAPLALVVSRIVRWLRFPFASRDPPS